MFNFFSLQRDDLIYLRGQICELIPTLSPDYIYQEFKITEFEEKIRAKGSLLSTVSNLKKHLRKAKLINYEEESSNDSYTEKDINEHSGKN